MTVSTALTRLHGRTAPGVPRWAVRAAYAVTLTVLPSCVWRIAAFTFDAPLVERLDAPPPGHGPVLIGDATWYVIVLSVVSEALAFLAVGLVADWGETWPRWIPHLGGRPVPTLAAVVPAGLGAAVLMVFPHSLLMAACGRMLNGHPATALTHGWQTPVFWLAYLPLAAWGPLLATLTVHYHRRRTRQ
ncbi:hypothetical protein GCM10010441_55020 [Kitasatospora paracochleata]|uniref:Uncharacterized protein n=1 Tax=Kitasatospora paracochleata TaxID=58354 RepID=A0ABT1J771_9ACTN|nr:hypothetical protein [Kitasatospora paracochleata]MCP2313248.1 hypothetical protein [Kitasatospora paracochleata]